MAPAAFEPAWPNPFALQVTEAPEATTSPKSKPGAATNNAQGETTPQTAGLKLASVTIGPRRRTATISGDTYVEGELVLVESKVASARPLGFRVVRIEAHGVELERDGKTWRLEFGKPKLAHGDEIESSNADEQP